MLPKTTLHHSHPSSIVVSPMARRLNRQSLAVPCFVLVVLFWLHSTGLIGWPQAATKLQSAALPGRYRSKQADAQAVVSAFFSVLETLEARWSGC